jgi:hypothetical protein
MDLANLELTPQQRNALLAQPDSPVYISDRETKKVYVLFEQGKFPALEEAYIRDRLEEGFAAVERGDVEEWDAASIKTAGRQLLNRQTPKE